MPVCFLPLNHIAKRHKLHKQQFENYIISNIDLLSDSNKFSLLVEDVHPILQQRLKQIALFEKNILSEGEQ